MIINPVFEIGQRVYSVLPDSPVGIVIDIDYCFSADKILYKVSFDATRESLWYNEIELSETKTFM